MKVGDKFVIEITETFGQNSYKIKGLNSVYSKDTMDKLEPFDKALSSELEEAYQKGYEVGQHETTTLEYQQGLNDAWETIAKIAKMPDGERGKVFGETWISNILNGNSLAEITEKLKAYEQQKADAEIKVGDEIKNTLELMNNAVGYFIEPTNNEYYRVLRYVNGKIDIVAWHKENCVRTGKHSYAVERMIVVLKGGM